MHGQQNLADLKKNIGESGTLDNPTVSINEKASGTEVSATMDPLVFLHRHWISYLDNLLQVSLLPALGQDCSTLRVPTGIREMTIRGSRFHDFLTKMRDGSSGMRVINSTGSMTPSSMGSSASIYSASPSVDSDASAEGNQSQKDRLKYITQAQALSGVQLVSILPYGKVASDIAEVIGMKTGLMARSGKMKEDAARVLHVVRKEVISSLDGGNCMQEGEKSGPALMLGSSVG